MSDEQHPANTSDDLAGRLHDLWLELNDAHAEPPATARVLNALADASEAAARLSALERQVA
jgi:hypothetical protein